MGNWGVEDTWQGNSQRTWCVRQQLVVPHLHGDKPGGTTRSETEYATQGSSEGKSTPQNLWL